MCKSCGWEKAADDIDELIDALDGLPDRAAEFAEGVRERLSGMHDWVTKNGHITPKMLDAVGNIGSGVAKWGHD